MQELNEALECECPIPDTTSLAGESERAGLMCTGCTSCSYSTVLARRRTNCLQRLAAMPALNLPPQVHGPLGFRNACFDYAGDKDRDLDWCCDTASLRTDSPMACNRLILSSAETGPAIRVWIRSRDPGSEAMNLDKVLHAENCALEPVPCCTLCKKTGGGADSETAAVGNLNVVISGYTPCSNMPAHDPSSTETSSVACTC